MSYLAVNEQRLTAACLRVPARGVWSAACDFEADPVLSGRVTLTIGTLSLSGTVVEAQSGVFGQQRRARIVGGAGGWGKLLPAKGYHNDARVKARLLADDLAREIGETIGRFEPAADRVGVDYARDATLSAAALLEDAIGDVPWWVDFAGVTHVGQRPTAAPLAEADFQLVEFDARERLAVLAVADPGVVTVGTVIAGAMLPEAQTVREYQVQADATRVRVFVWTQPRERSAGRLAGLWKAVTARTVSAPLFGLYTYRVISMAFDGRVSLQAVHRSNGLPDLDSIPQWPGVAGIHNELVRGAQVLVAFIDGDSAKPIVTHYSGKGGDGFVPVSIVIGGEPAMPCARQGDTVETILMPAVIIGTLTTPGGPMPITGTVQFPLQTALGSITTGSSKVKVAT